MPEQPGAIEKEENQAAEIPESAGTSLWRNRNFNIFWAGQTLSALGDAFAIIAIPLLVLQATGSVAQMGLVTATFGIGQFLSGLISGIMVDRVDRRRLMILCDAGRTLAYGLVPVVWWWLGPQMWLIFIMTLAGSFLGMTFTIAYNTAVPNLVDKDQVTYALGRLQAAMSISFVLGPTLAGVISAQFGPPAAILINAGSFAVSAVTLSFIRLRRATAERTSANLSRGVLRDWLEGFQFLIRHRVLRNVTILLGVYFFLTSGALDLFIFYLKHNLGQDDNSVGIVFGLASLGSIVGSVLAPTFRRKLGFGACWLGGMALESIVLGTMGLATSVLVVGLLAIAFTFLDIVRGISSMSLRQEVTPDHLLGRVTAVFMVLVGVPGPLGAAFTTWMAENLGSQFVLGLIGIVGILVALIGAFTPARMRHPEKLGLPPSPLTGPNLSGTSN